MIMQHAIETTAVAVTSSTLIATSVMVSSAQGQQSIELQVLLLPMIGSMLMSVVFIMLNPTHETLRVTIGRSILAMFLGIVVPQVVGLFVPVLESLVSKPFVLVLLGGVVSGIGFACAKPLAEYLFRHSGGFIRDGGEKLRKKYLAGEDEPTEKK